MQSVYSAPHQPTRRGVDTGGGFMFFPKGETQIGSFRIWTSFADLISHVDNWNTKHAIEIDCLTKDKKLSLPSYLPRDEEKKLMDSCLSQRN